MPFVIALLYLATAYLGPSTLFGPLAAAHIELILAALALFVSLPALQGSLIWKTPQSLALIGLAFAVLLSILTTGWAGGAMMGFLTFIPSAFAYFLVCLHCNSKKRIQLLILMLLFVCLFVIARGYYDLQQGLTDSDYLFAQSNDAGEVFYRIRGQDFINDPNDFAQLIVCVVPLVFIFWRPKKILKNVTFVIVPECLLLFGAFLTHSRGSVLALLAIVVVAARRRIGTLPSLLLAVGLFVGASALHFTGGREISAESGSGRMDLWAGGMQALKSHPLFGVGFGQLPDYIGMTAHNSVVVCAAELGLIGLYFWSLFVFPTLRAVLAIASPAKVSEGEQVVIEKAPRPFLRLTVGIEELDKTEINRLGRLMLLSLTGFLVAAWFLSRAFVMTLFLLGGLVEVIFEMARRRSMIAPRMPIGKLLRYAGGFTFSLLVLTYVVLRVGNLFR
jgi:O-antigen ligase